MELTQKILDHIVTVTLDSSYKCTACGRIVPPKMVLKDDGSVDVIKDEVELRGGKKNEIIVRVCQECADRLNSVFREYAKPITQEELSAVHGQDE